MKKLDDSPSKLDIILCVIIWLALIAITGIKHIDNFRSEKSLTVPTCVIESDSI